MDITSVHAMHHPVSWLRIAIRCECASRLVQTAFKPNGGRIWGWPFRCYADSLRCVRVRDEL